MGVNMCKRDDEFLTRIRRLCHLGSIDSSKFWEQVEVELKNRLKNLFAPNVIWFGKGKSLERYWRWLEQITDHEWNYEDVNYWYKFIRDPSDTREEISPSLRYQVLTRDESTCKKCGRKTPDVELQVDHMLPWACGGSTVVDNLQSLCRECNQGKSDLCFERGD